MITFDFRGLESVNTNITPK